MLCQLAHERLKTNSLLWERKIIEEPSCGICGEPHESNLHAVRDCYIPKQVWERLLLKDQVKEFWVVDEVREWIAWNMAWQLGLSTKKEIGNMYADKMC